MKYLSHYPQAQVRSTTVPCQASMMASSPMSTTHHKKGLFYIWWGMVLILGSVYHLSYLVLVARSPITPCQKWQEAIEDYYYYYSLVVARSWLVDSKQGA